jgi:hypothetical protein
MRLRSSAAVLFLGAAVVSAGCANSEQWAEWRQHSSQFASFKHMGFSLRHRGENPQPHVTQGDVEKAQLESWWGDPIVVRPDQIFAG